MRARPSMGIRRPRAIALVLSLMLLVVGCGPSSTPTTTATTAAAGQSTTTGAEQTTTSAAVEASTITIGVDSETDRFDPGNGNIHITARAVHHLVYGALMSANADAEYVPYMAESLTPNDDATVWTLKVRPGLVMHDGSPYDSAAVKFSMDRIRLESLGAEAVSYVTDVEIVDDLTVTITLDKPYGVFPQVLADEMGVILSKDAVTAGGEAYATSEESPPIGAGPYRVVEWVRDDHLTLEKFDQFFMGDERGLVDRIIFRIIPDDAARAAALEAGDVDVITTLSPGTILSFVDNSDFQVFQQPYGATGILFNVEAVPDIRVRQAVAMAIDKDTLIDLVWDGIGGAITTPIAEDNFWHHDVSYPEFDPDGAAALIEEVEAESGPVSLTLTPRIDETSVNFGTAVVEQLKAVGIDAELAISVDTNDFVNRYVEGDYELIGTGVFVILDPWFEYTRRYHSTSPLNGTGFATVYPELQAEMDAALDIGAASTDRDERKAAYDRVQEILAENLLQLFVRSDVYGVIMSNEIQGYGTGVLPNGGISLGNYFTAILGDELYRG